MIPVITRFEKNGVSYHLCSRCPIGAERYQSPERIVFNGAKWAIENGYTPKAFTLIPENAKRLPFK